MAGDNLLVIVQYALKCVPFKFMASVTHIHTHTHTLYNPLYYFNYKIGYCTRQKNGKFIDNVKKYHKNLDVYV